MRTNIVEGEPGIFPDPVARVLGRVNGWVRRRLLKEDRPPADQGGEEGGGEAGSGHQAPGA